MKINNESVRGFFLYSENAEYESGDFVVDGNTIYVCSPKGSLTVTGEEPRLSENFEVYLGEQMADVSEFIKFSEEGVGSKKYVSLTALPAILNNYMAGLTTSGIIGDSVDYSDDYGFHVNIKELDSSVTFEVNSVLSDLLINESLNHGIFKVSRYLPEISTYVGLEDKDNYKYEYCILKQYTYQDQLGQLIRVQELVDHEDGHIYYRSCVLDSDYNSSPEFKFATINTLALQQKANKLFSVYAERLNGFRERVKEIEGQFCFSPIAVEEEGKEITLNGDTVSDISNVGPITLTILTETKTSSLSGVCYESNTITVDPHLGDANYYVKDDLYVKVDAYSDNDLDETTYYPLLISNGSSNEVNINGVVVYSKTNENILEKITTDLEYKLRNITGPYQETAFRYTVTQTVDEDTKNLIGPYVGIFNNSGLEGWGSKYDLQRDETSDERIDYLFRYSEVAGDSKNLSDLCLIIEDTEVIPYTVFDRRDGSIKEYHKYCYPERPKRGFYVEAIPGTSSIAILRRKDGGLIKSRSMSGYSYTNPVFTNEELEKYAKSDFIIEIVPEKTGTFTITQQADIDYFIQDGSGDIVAFSKLDKDVEISFEEFPATSKLFLSRSLTYQGKDKNLELTATISGENDLLRGENILEIPWDRINGGSIIQPGQLVETSPAIKITLDYSEIELKEGEEIKTTLTDLRDNTSFPVSDNIIYYYGINYGIQVDRLGSSESSSFIDFRCDNGITFSNLNDPNGNYSKGFFNNLTEDTTYKFTEAEFSWIKLESFKTGDIQVSLRKEMDVAVPVMSESVELKLYNSLNSLYVSGYLDVYGVYYGEEFKFFKKVKTLSENLGRIDLTALDTSKEITIKFGNSEDLGEDDPELNIRVVDKSGDTLLEVEIHSYDLEEKLHMPDGVKHTEYNYQVGVYHNGDRLQTVLYNYIDDVWDYYNNFQSLISEDQFKDLYNETEDVIVLKLSPLSTSNKYTLGIYLREDLPLSDNMSLCLPSNPESTLFYCGEDGVGLEVLASGRTDRGFWLEDVLEPELTFKVVKSTGDVLDEFSMVGTKKEKDDGSYSYSYGSYTEPIRSIEKIYGNTVEIHPKYNKVELSSEINGLKLNFQNITKKNTTITIPDESEYPVGKVERTYFNFDDKLGLGRGCFDIKVERPGLEDIIVLVIYENGKATYDSPSFSGTRSYFLKSSEFLDGTKISVTSAELVEYPVEYYRTNVSNIKCGVSEFSGMPTKIEIPKNAYNSNIIITSDSSSLFVNSKVYSKTLGDEVYKIPVKDICDSKKLAIEGLSLATTTPAPTARAMSLRSMSSISSGEGYYSISYAAEDEESIPSTNQSNATKTTSLTKVIISLEGNEAAQSKFISGYYRKYLRIN